MSRKCDGCRYKGEHQEPHFRPPLRPSDEWDELPSEQIHRQAVQASTRPTRPCEVNGKPAIFHRWVENDRVIIQINSLCRPGEVKEYIHRYRSECVIPPTCSSDVLRETFALVEYDDGSVCKVEPERVKFTDRRPKE